jgi:hypothetical protein
MWWKYCHWVNVKYFMSLEFKELVGWDVYKLFRHLNFFIYQLIIKI